MFRNFAIAYARKNIRMRRIRKLNFQRQSTAFMLSIAQRDIPLAAGNLEFDVTPLIEYGERVIREMKGESDKHSPEDIAKMAVHKNLSSFYLKMIAHVMHRVPVMNSLMDWAPLRNGGELYECEDIRPAFTVHTNRGLIAPHVLNPHLKPLVQVADEMRIQVHKARRTDLNQLYRRCAWTYLRYALSELNLTGFAGAVLWAKSSIWPEPMDDEVKNTPEDEKLQPHDVIGSTCVIANISMETSGWQTVLQIPPPSTFAWGIGGTRLAARVVNGQVAPRHVMTMAVVFDHRAMDGGDIFAFEDILNGYIQNPERIFEWKSGDPI